MRTRLTDGDGDVLQGGQRILADRHEGDAAAVRHQRVHTRHVREAVVERNDNQQHLVFVDGDDAGALFHVGRVVSVGEQDTFRICSRTGSVADVRVVVGADRFVAGLELRAVLDKERIAHCLDLGNAHLAGFQRVVVEGRVVEHDDLLHGRALADDGADLRQLVAGHQNPLRIGMMDAEQKVAPLAQVHRQRHVGRAGVQGADLGDDPHGAALREQGDLIALFQTKRHQARADALRSLTGLFLRDFQPLPIHLLA